MRNRLGQESFVPLKSDPRIRFHSVLDQKAHRNKKNCQKQKELSFCDVCQAQALSRVTQTSRGAATRAAAWSPRAATWSPRDAAWSPRDAAWSPRAAPATPWGLCF